MTHPPRPPRQVRSRESEKKLIKAMMELLGQSGLEGVSIPRVAECAGLTPGAVYRRFADKNALIERVILEILEAQLAQLQQTLTPEFASKNTLAALVETLVSSMLTSVRANATLINALRQFARNSDHRAFKRKAAELEDRTLKHLAGVLLTKRAEIRHPDPEPALRLAFFMLSTTPLGLFLNSARRDYAPHIVPDDDEWLTRELTRMFLGYIGAT